MWGAPPRSETHAIWRPVGDQVGSVSMPACRVSRRMTPVARLRTWISGLPVTLSVIAMDLPSGEKDGEELMPTNAASVCSGRRSNGNAR